MEHLREGNGRWTTENRSLHGQVNEITKKLQTYSLFLTKPQGVCAIIQANSIESNVHLSIYLFTRLAASVDEVLEEDDMNFSEQLKEYLFFSEVLK